MSFPFKHTRIMACAGICFVFACCLDSLHSTAQSAQSAFATAPSSERVATATLPAEPVVTLDPPTGAAYQAHAFNAQGVRLPEAPANFRRLGEARVGEPSDVQTLTFRFGESTRLTGIKTTNEFRIVSGGSCQSGNAYEKGSTCSLLVRFTPQGPGNRLGKVSLNIAGSATSMAFGLGGFGYSPVVSFVPSVITTVPGTYPSSVGLLSGAQNLTVDASDTLWVADSANGLVRQMDSSGTFRTLASGYTGVMGIAVDTFGQAYFDVPSTGKMYEIYDYGPVVQASGAGTAACPVATPCVLSSEALGTPGEMSMDPYNHLFFVDSHQGAAFSTVQPIPANLIFLYDPFPYQQSPSGAMAVDSGDNMYSLWANGGVCEIVQQSLYNAENSNVSFNKIAGGHTCGFAGDGGLAGNAEIGNKVGQIAFDVAGDLYFSDTANQRVRRIDYTTGVIRTIAGYGTAGYGGDTYPATLASLNNPTGVGVDSQGSVYIISSATTGQVIRKVGPQGRLIFGNVSKGTTSSVYKLYVTNTGNSTMVLTSYVIGGANASEFTVDASNTTCNLTAGATLYSGQTCFIGLRFTPAATGNRTATLTFLDNTVLGTDITNLSGVGTLPVPVMTITSPTPGQSFTSGTPVTFAVKLAGSPVPTGTVQFKVDGAVYGGPVAVSSTGTASTTVTGLTQTTHSLSATYSGDTAWAPAGPVSVSTIVTAAKVVSIVSLKQMAGTATECSGRSFLVNVTGASGPVPVGEVQLRDGGTVIATKQLSNGAAVLNSVRLSAGSYKLNVVYLGDAHHTSAVSGTLQENVGTNSRCTHVGTGGLVGLQGEVIQ